MRFHVHSGSDKGTLYQQKGIDGEGSPAGSDQSRWEA
jgi:hypothetical protein